MFDVIDLGRDTRQRSRKVSSDRRARRGGEGEEEIVGGSGNYAWVPNE